MVPSALPVGRHRFIDCVDCNAIPVKHILYAREVSRSRVLLVSCFSLSCAVVILPYAQIQYLLSRLRGAHIHLPYHLLIQLQYSIFTYISHMAASPFTVRQHKLLCRLFSLASCTSAPRPHIRRVVRSFMRIQRTALAAPPTSHSSSKPTRRTVVGACMRLVSDVITGLQGSGPAPLPSV